MYRDRLKRTKTLSACTLLAMAVTVLPATADVIIVDESITYTDPPVGIIAENNPFDFLFTSLPTIPVSPGIFEFTGLADMGDPGEFFEVFFDGVLFVGFDPGSEDFFERFELPVSQLTSLVADGGLLVQIVFSEAVNSPLPGDFITTRLTFDGVAGVPEPTSALLLLVGLAGLGLLRRRGTVPD